MRSSFFFKPPCCFGEGVLCSQGHRYQSPLALSGLLSHQTLLHLEYSDHSAESSVFQIWRSMVLFLWICSKPGCLVAFGSNGPHKLAVHQGYMLVQQGSQRSVFEGFRCLQKRSLTAKADGTGFQSLFHVAVALQAGASNSLDA